MKSFASSLLAFGALAFVSSCSFVTYTDENGRTGLKPKYPPGTSIVYQDGTYDTNHRYNNFRPHESVLLPPSSGDADSAPSADR